MRPMKKVTIFLNTRHPETNAFLKETFVFQKAADAKKLAKAVTVFDHVHRVIIEDYELAFDQLGHALMTVARAAD